MVFAITMGTEAGANGTEEPAGARVGARRAPAGIFGLICGLSGGMRVVVGAMEIGYAFVVWEGE